ncbi:MAG: CapA family protein [Chitinophagales bacterium]
MRRIKYLLPAGVSIALALIYFTGIFSKPVAEEVVLADVTPIPVEDSIQHITIASVGDLMCHSTQYKYARIEGDSFDFRPCFSYVRSYLESADLTLGNLETVTAGNKVAYSGYPYFNSPDDYINSIADVGFDFLVTANNHANDQGEKGITRTISILDANGLQHTGTYTSEKDRDSIRVVDVKGVHIAILAYTYSTNDNPLTPGKPWLVNMCDSALIRQDILKARTLSDLVLVFYHFGEEYKRLPGDYQKGFVQHAIDCGADIILGSHPHVLEPALFFATQNAKLDTGFAIYSMGNFISNQRDMYTDEGVIVQLHIAKNKHTGACVLEKADYIPTWVYRGEQEEMKLHMVFPANAPDSLLPPFVGKYYSKDVADARTHTEAIFSTYTNAFRPAVAEN